MKIYFLFFIAFLFFISCSPDKEKLPEGILPPEKMIQILADVQITEAAMMYQSSKGIISDSKIPAHYQYIFNKNKITEKQFRASFNYYMGHVEKMDKLYEEVINEISKRQAEVVN